MSESPSYIDNVFPELLSLSSPPLTLLSRALEHILRSMPPDPPYAASRKLSGFFAGPLALAYLFLRLSEIHPDLSIEGHPLRYWAISYGCCERQEDWRLSPPRDSCGLTSETLSGLALRACMTQQTEEVEAFVKGLSEVLEPPTAAAFRSQLLFGRAGTLYLLRAVRHFVPHAAALLEGPAEILSRYILDVGDDGQGNWICHGRQYIGAAHGEIGILTQLVLTTPSLAPELQPRLEFLLDGQLDSGNWPNSAVAGSERHVKWCHGAPGFVISLLALRAYFPALKARIDDAVGRARGCIWERGLLRKEPNLCHGILGNAL